MRKALLILWVADSAALVWLFTYILLHGSNPDRAALAGDLGAISGGLGVALLVLWWKERKQRTKA